MLQVSGISKAYLLSVDVVFGTAKSKVLLASKIQAVRSDVRGIIEGGNDGLDFFWFDLGGSISLCSFHPTVSIC